MLPVFRSLRLFGATLASATLAVSPSQGQVDDAAAIPDAATSTAATSSGEEAGFQGYLQLLAARARGDGVREATIAAMTSGLTFNPRVIALDRAQPGSSANPSLVPAFAPYRRTHVDDRGGDPHGREHWRTRLL